MHLQDMIHIGVKLKARLLKPSIVLPMGFYLACSAHLQIITNIYGKDTHKLRNSDLNHHDRQNFGAVENIVKAAHLLDDIPEALGTRCYIDIIQSAVYSFLSKTMTPESRLENIWFATFMLRYWRQWILLHPTFTLQHNFITTNAYVCIEVNAHSLLSIVIRMRNGDLRSITPWDIGSQSCEHFFRSLRSMTRTFSTIINFSLLGILQHIHRLY